MNDRDRLKLRIVTALHNHDVNCAERALSLWNIALKIDEAGKVLSMRFVARVIEVLRLDGYLETSQRRDEPDVFWLAKENALSELRAHLGFARNLVGEAHLIAETQLPERDFCVTSQSEEDEEC